MVDSFSDWLCNVMLWGAIATVVLLLGETFVSPGILHNWLNSVIGLVAVAGLAALWPKY
ncbi:MAG: hypothetical protein AB7O44_22960 [Hyphomicrobiaceae bacterium]|jgi:hypothetical protein